jgi:hypothetical protein
MGKYEVTITETLKTKVEVEADSLDDAEQIVTDKWHNSEYVLDAENFAGVEFSAEEAEQEITVLLVQPNKRPEVINIKTGLEDMQKIVGGLIEEYMPFEEEVAIIVNEEGKINGLPLNRAVKNEDGEIIDIIVGDFFICSADTEQFTSLSEKQIEKYKKMFQYPERFFKADDGIKAVPFTPETSKPRKDYER